MSVDGTDCPIYEPSPWNKKWYSHKFKSAGLRYEIGVGLQSGNICWVNGPFPAGSWPDLKIFKSKLVNRLGPNEKVEADRGYRHHKCRMPGKFVSLSDKRAKSKARACHDETVNARLKQLVVSVRISVMSYGSIKSALKLLWCAPSLPSTMVKDYSQSPTSFPNIE